MVAKNPDAFRTISEVAEELDLPQHVLRFWETRFTQIKPLKRGGGRRYYRPDDVDLLRGIRLFLYGEGYTIRGVQRILKEQGVRFVMSAGRGELSGMMPGRPDPRRLEDDDGDDHDDENHDDVALDIEPRLHRPQPAPRRLPLRPDPDFDVEPEDHDPGEEPRHLAPFDAGREEDDQDEERDAYDHDDGHDSLDDDDAIRRMAERFAPAAPPLPPAPRRDPPPPPRAAPPRPPPRPEPAPVRHERAPEPEPPRTAPPRALPDAPRQPANAPRPQAAPPQPVRAGLSRDDIAQLHDVMAELLDLKRILDQAR